MHKFLLIIGLFISSLAIALPLLNIIPAGAAIAIAVPGITMSILGWLFGRSTDPAKAGSGTVQTIFSADKNLRAVIYQRNDGNYQVETWQLFPLNNSDSGYSWVRQNSSGIVDSLSAAVDIANEYIRTMSR